MIFRSLKAPGIAIAGVAIHSIENLDQIEDANLQAGFFQEFAGDAIFERFSQFEISAGDRPLPTQRLSAAADKKNTVSFDYDTADSNHRPIRVFSSHETSFSLQQFQRLNCQEGGALAKGHLCI
jgi:hypothetical protein